MTIRGGLNSFLTVTMLAALSSVGQISGAADAVPASKFLDSIGANSAIDRRGESLAKSIECTKYLGLRWFRSGVENNPSIQDFIELHKQTGARFSWGTLSGGTDLPKLFATAHELAAADALLAFEGPNEPNNWGITYNGQTGGKNASWVSVASLQRDLYKGVKSDPVLKKYPVWGISENGAEEDNVGLQFLTIPKGANCVMPDGTRYADYANVHNYVFHPNSPKVEDNKTWNAADPTSATDAGPRPLHGATFSFTAKLTTRVGVMVPATPRGNRLELWDRATDRRWPLPWPPVEMTGAMPGAAAGDPAAVNPVGPASAPAGSLLPVAPVAPQRVGDAGPASQ